MLTADVRTRMEIIDVSKEETSVILKRGQRPSPAWQKQWLNNGGVFEMKKEVYELD